MVVNDGTWVRRARALRMGLSVLAAGPSWLLRGLRRNVSLYSFFAEYILLRTEYILLRMKKKKKKKKGQAPV